MGKNTLTRNKCPGVVSNYAITTQVCVYGTTPNKLHNDVSPVSGEILNHSKHYRTTTNTISSTDTRRVSAKKWQVGRVSRKHYEIVNMLWRKTKIFLSPESTTPESKYKRSNSKIPVSTEITPHGFTSLWLLSQSSTPSYIEFYYLDDDDDRIMRRESIITRKNEKKMQQEQINNNANTLHRLKPNPILTFHINDHFSTIKTSTVMRSPKRTYGKPKKHNLFRQDHPLYDFILSRLESKVSAKKKLKPTLSSNKRLAVSKRTSQYETCPTTTQETEYNMTMLSQSTTPNLSSEVNSSFSATTPYDKIIFFEIYDQHTEIPASIHYKESMFHKIVKDDYLDSNHTVLLEDINKNLGHHDGLNEKFVKKHIEEDFHNDIDNDQMEQKSKFQTKSHENKKGWNVSRIVSDGEKSVPNHTIPKVSKSQNNIAERTRNSSRLALWSDYPFSAVYVYEPSQIHCDTAALSPHWLVAAGSCLSRFYHKDTMTGRSAFVVYCSQNWWAPERVSYVKYSVVHPRYNPKDIMRRYLYNIGLVQVVGSMSSCSGWGPISLMSHHFAAGSEGSAATAVGWGLDRYDVMFSLSKLPRKPLSVFKGIVYSNLCPGNMGYRKLKSRNEDIIKNIYCLLLPHYVGEENDPVHGSMLLVGGKLIALYIQEERRPFGIQSAQYTSIWRLVPWIHEVAKEPDDDDILGIDV